LLNDENRGVAESRADAVVIHVVGNTRENGLKSPRRSFMLLLQSGAQFEDNGYLP
jgi:hypothetical protein